jgi:hypothetical protein
MDKPNDYRKSLQDSIQNMRANVEHTEMMLGEFAHLYWIGFQSLKKEGFTDDQAMRIVCARGPFLTGPSSNE